jgi:hypothetical protein
VSLQEGVARWRALSACVQEHLNELIESLEDAEQWTKILDHDLRGALECVRAENEDLRAVIEFGSQYANRVAVSESIEAQAVVREKLETLRRSSEMRKI